MFVSVLELKYISFSIQFWSCYKVLKVPSLKIIHQLETNPDNSSPFTINHQQLRYKGRLVIPRQTSFIEAILSDFHDNPVGGHAGYLRTYKRIANQFYWTGMKGDIKRNVSECQVCQINKTNSLSPAGLLQPFPYHKTSGKI